jgi:hypothetical protein
MKTSIKFATGLILAAAALVASGSAAQAGEGGAAGSVSIKFAGTTSPNTSVVNGNTVTVQVPDVARLSTSVAVGKSYAVATASTSGSSTSTSAIGSGGGFNINANGSAYAGTAETTGSSGNQSVNQANTFGGSGATTLKPTTGVTLAD